MFAGVRGNRLEWMPIKPLGENGQPRVAMLHCRSGQLDATPNSVASL